MLGLVFNTALQREIKFLWPVTTRAKREDAIRDLPAVISAVVAFVVWQQGSQVPQLPIASGLGNLTCSKEDQTNQLCAAAPPV